MEFLEKLGDFFNALTALLERFFTRLFGSSNERLIRRMGFERKGDEVTILKDSPVDRINQLEPEMQKRTDAELKELTDQFRARLAGGETLDDLLTETFAAAREAGWRFVKMRNYDVQLIGGIVLHQGKIAEMVTGEGKTLVATLAAYLNALEGKGVHVVTVNDYLARRDREWMGPLYMGLGLSVGAIQGNVDSSGHEGIRRKAYLCDITYGTNNEFGFDYLRDNMKPAMEMQVQRELNYAVVDEVDNILIDEARTPLIISGPAFDDTSRYYKSDRVARQLKKGVHFEIKEKEHTCHMSEEGVREAERLAGVESFYTAGNMEWPHLIDNSLKAHHLYKRDVNYVVMDGEIVIVDEFTGRLMPGRNWSDGLHQSVEAKEGVRIKEENQTLATITLQNFFKLYNKLAGMTGTAMTEANEFWKIYKLDVVAMPTNQPLRRDNYPDVIFRTEKEKFNAIVDEIREVHKTGRPILVGTVSIEKSERLSSMLGRFGVKHEVLNAKHHEREAEIVAQAGRKGVVTIATNMAGRGTDIVLGGNPEYLAWDRLQEKYESRLDVPREEWDALVAEIEQKEKMTTEGREVAEAGGLHIIGTERHEARRIDNQLRGRAGRQGDPGSGRFFLSLEDDLMRIFAGEWVASILTKLGMQEGEAIESKMVSRRIGGAQKKVEERNFEIRKNLLEYDELMDEQRKRVYSYRQRILDGENCKDLVLEMIDRQVDRNVERFLAPTYGIETFSQWCAGTLGVEIEVKDLRGLEFDDTEQFAKNQAARQSKVQIYEQIEEHLPDDEEVSPSEWNWGALAKWLNTRWNLSITERELKRIGRENLDSELIERVERAVEKIDCSPGREYLADDWGRRSVCGWAQHKFALALSPEDLAELDAEDVKHLVREKAREAYTNKEIEFPVAVGMAQFLAERTAGQTQRYDRDGLVKWANNRFSSSLEVSELRNKPRSVVRERLIQCSKDFFRNGEVSDQVEEHLDRAFGHDAETAEDNGENGTGGISSSNTPALQELTQWAEHDLHCQVSVDELTGLDRSAARQRLMAAVDERFRPEMREMERALVLQILDTSWKDHLYAMDHLRSSVGLRGYAQVDPKVEYKREGMRIFEEMWDGVDDKVTGLVFRMEQADIGFVRSLWQITDAVHEEAPGTGDIRAQQQTAIEGSSQSERKSEPIRHRGQRVGRNDPCPCGSGKKYKQCCMGGGR